MVKSCWWAFLVVLWLWGAGFPVTMSEHAPRTRLTCHRPRLDADAAEGPSGRVVCVGDAVVGSLVGRDGSRWLFGFLCQHSLQGFCSYAPAINDLASEMKISFWVSVLLALA